MRDWTARALWAVGDRMVDAGGWLMRLARRIRGVF